MRRIAAAIAAALAAAVARADAPLPVVPGVDLSRYAGKWHEIARYPNFFERFCVRDVTATYALNPDGTIRVVNECRKADGEIARAEGTARVPRPAETTAKLEVRFAPDWLAWLPFVWANYWVVELAPDYRYAVVGEPTREYLWILARTPGLDEPTWRGIVGRLPALGYDPARLVRNPAPQPR